MSENKMRLWTMRYKGQRGVQSGVVEAADSTEAEAVSRAFCAEQASNFYRFIRIDGPLVLADPSILKKKPGPAAAAEPVLEKPSLSEQRERLANRGGGSRDDSVEA